MEKNNKNNKKKRDDSPMNRRSSGEKTSCYVCVKKSSAFHGSRKFNSLPSLLEPATCLCMYQTDQVHNLQICVFKFHFNIFLNFETMYSK